MNKIFKIYKAKINKFKINWIQLYMKSNKLANYSSKINSYRKRI